MPGIKDSRAVLMSRLPRGLTKHTVHYPSALFLAFTYLVPRHPSSPTVEFARVDLVVATPTIPSGRYPITDVHEWAQPSPYCRPIVNESLSEAMPLKPVARYFRRGLGLGCQRVWALAGESDRHAAKSVAQVSWTDGQP